MKKWLTLLVLMLVPLCAHADALQTQTYPGSVLYPGGDMMRQNAYAGLCQTQEPRLSMEWSSPVAFEGKLPLHTQPLIVKWAVEVRSVMPILRRPDDGPVREEEDMVALKEVLLALGDRIIGLELGPSPASAYDVRSPIRIGGKLTGDLLVEPTGLLLAGRQAEDGATETVAVDLIDNAPLLLPDSRHSIAAPLSPVWMRGVTPRGFVPGDGGSFWATWRQPASYANGRLAFTTDATACAQEAEQLLALSTPNGGVSAALPLSSGMLRYCLQTSGDKYELVCLAESGDVKWRAPAVNEAGEMCVTALDDGYAVVLLEAEAGQYQLHALDAKSGAALWTRRFPTTLPLETAQAQMRTPIAGQGTQSDRIVVTVNESPQDCTIYCINKASGDILWQERCTGSIVTRPVMIHLTHETTTDYDAYDPYPSSTGAALAVAVTNLDSGSYLALYQMEDGRLLDRTPGDLYGYVIAADLVAYRNMLVTVSTDGHWCNVEAYRLTGED